MDKHRPISQLTHRFVERKLSEIARQSKEGSGYFRELARQNFTDGVDRLAARMKRPELRTHWIEQAQQTGRYMGEEKRLGRWTYDVERQAPRWRGETPDAWKKPDAMSEWRTISGDERARYVFGHSGNDAQAQNHYPGIQVEKEGIAGPVKWGPEQPGPADAHAHAQKMLDRYCTARAAHAQLPSQQDVPKRGTIPPPQVAEGRSSLSHNGKEGRASSHTSPARKYGEEAQKALRPERLQGRSL